MVVSPFHSMDLVCVCGHHQKGEETVLHLLFGNLMSSLGYILSLPLTKLLTHFPPNHCLCDWMVCSFTAHVIDDLPKLTIVYADLSKLSVSSNGLYPSLSLEICEMRVFPTSRDFSFT